MKQSNIGFPDPHHSFKKELALAIIPAVVSLAVQSAFEHVAAYVQHKRDEKAKVKELEAHNEQQPTEEELMEMEKEQEKALRTIVREEVIGALKDVLVVSPPAETQPQVALTKQPRKIKRTKTNNA